jgi:hypothetical protein
MPNLFFCQPKSHPRQALLTLFVTSLLFLNACSGLFGTHKQVNVPPLLTPLVDANSAQLIAEVNRLASVKSIHGKLDIQFQDTSFAAAGIADKYRSVDATVTVQRPGKIYLVIQFTFVDIAEMASDGEHFRVAILKGDEKYKRFVKGTNNANYAELKMNGNGKHSGQSAGVKAERATVNALSNLRPQHLTDAFLIRPITQAAESGYLYSQSEFFEEVPDTRPQAKKSARVVRGYYLLEELSHSASGEAKLRRRFWFDRVDSIHLARLQMFDDTGLLDMDISYNQDKPVGGNQSTRMPSHIELTRKKDEYSISLTYQAPESVTIDKEWPPQVFVLENKWGLPEVDLDAKDPRATNPP